MYITIAMDQLQPTEREIEIKIDLGSFTNYLKLVGFLGRLDGEVSQRNTFFDTGRQQLMKAGWALRVRVENDRGLLTVKGLHAERGAAMVRREIECEIPRSQAESCVQLDTPIMALDLAPVNLIREVVGDADLVVLTAFNNTRQLKSFRIGESDYRLEIDKTEFADGSCDYEIEVELDSEEPIEAVSRGLRKLLESLDIEFVIQTETKFARALARAGLL
ncbi:MAG: CYTH domain-containing protein [bacterium]